MAKEPNERELKLAARVNELSDAEAAPTVAGVGMFSLAVNFLMRRVTKGIGLTRFAGVACGGVLRG